MMLRVQSRIADVKAQLDDFPEPPKKPKQVITNLIRKVVECLAAHVEASGDENILRAAFHDCLSGFSAELRLNKLDVHIETAPYSATDEEPNEEDVEIKPLRHSRTAVGETEAQKERKAESALDRPSKRRASRTFVEHTTMRLDDLK
jgi:hypothetical protein